MKLKRWSLKHTEGSMTATEILEKHGIKPTRNKTANDKVAERAAEIVKEEVIAKGPSRNDLMLQAKAKGIKNFRILNKADLYKVLDPATIQQEIDSIVADAVAKWKLGWGTRKVANV